MSNSSSTCPEEQLLLLLLRLTEPEFVEPDFHSPLSLLAVALDLVLCLTTSDDLPCYQLQRGSAGRRGGDRPRNKTGAVFTEPMSKGEIENTG